MKPIMLTLTLFSILAWNRVMPQCEVLPFAEPDITLHFVQTGGTNGSGVAWNPGKQLYYALIAGNSGFPLETFDANGLPLYQTNTNFDSRGLWWNPNLLHPEMNGFSTNGLYTPDLDVNGYALSAGTVLFTGQNQPDAQSCGDYDWIADEVIFYYQGSVYRYDRQTMTQLGTYPLTGIPNINNINTTSVIFTGCPGNEIGLLDYVDKKVFLFNKSTGVMGNYSQLPASAVTNDMFRFSYANERVWTYDIASRTWFAYRIFKSTSTGINEKKEEGSVNILYLPAQQMLDIRINQPSAAGASVTVLNSAGTQVISQQLCSNSGLVSLDRLAPGIYMVTVYSSKMTCKKIIVY